MKLSERDAVFGRLAVLLAAKGDPSCIIGAHAALSPII